MWKRESLKIKLRIEPNVRSNPETYTSSLPKKVLRVVQSLVLGGTRDFMLILEADSAVLDTITDIGGDGNMLVNRTETQLVISNADCKICGYREKWMMIDDT